MLTAAVLLSSLAMMPAQTIVSPTTKDSDHDGLSDAQEAALLAQFAPRFMVSADDCSVRPAQFVPWQAKPVVEREDGTIYGQATPRAGHADEVELHFYHLWKTDCGRMGHNLDAEHVSALVTQDQDSSWKALYWYAAAHEDTVCDASQIARATTVDGGSRGPEIWISRGKHASFLSEKICAHGCGGDNCHETMPLAGTSVINLGELNAPMNGAVWAGSPAWPLAAKMQRSDFADARTARVDELPLTSIAWANPQKRPMQAVIHSGNNTLAGVATGERDTGTALDLAKTDTGQALTGARGSTHKGLARAIRGVGSALRATVTKTGKALAGH